jgi:acetyl esterase/lipase
LAVILALTREFETAEGYIGKLLIAKRKELAPRARFELAAVTATRYNGMIHDFVLLNAIHEVPGASRHATSKRSHQ